MNKFINIATVFVVLKNMISSFANEISLQTACVDNISIESKTKFYKRVNDSAFLNGYLDHLCYQKLIKLWY